MRHFVIYDATGEIIMKIKSNADYSGDACAEVSESDATANPSIESTRRIDMKTKRLVNKIDK